MNYALGYTLQQLFRLLLLEPVGALLQFRLAKYQKSRDMGSLIIILTLHRFLSQNI